MSIIDDISSLTLKLVNATICRIMRPDSQTTEEVDLIASILYFSASPYLTVISKHTSRANIHILLSSEMISHKFTKISHPRFKIQSNNFARWDGISLVTQRPVGRGIRILSARGQQLDGKSTVVDDWLHLIPTADHWGVFEPTTVSIRNNIHLIVNHILLFLLPSGPGRYSQFCILRLFMTC